MERNSPRTVRQARGVAGGSASCRSSNEQETKEREEISEDDVQELAAIVEIPDAFMFQSIMTHPVGARCLRWICAFEIMRLGRAPSLFLDGWPASSTFLSLLLFEASGWDGNQRAFGQFAFA